MNEKMREVQRVLFLGFNFSSTLENEVKRGLKNSEVFFSNYFPEYVLYDYDLIILNLAGYTHTYIKSLEERKPQIDTFLKAGKIMACFLTEPSEYEDSSGIYRNYYWSDLGYSLQNNLREGLGKVVKRNKESKFFKIFSNIFENKFQWRADVPQKPSIHQAEIMDPLAVNNVNIPVAFLIELKKDYGSGKAVFLPCLNEKSDEKIKGFYISLVNSLLRLSKPTIPVKVSETSIPTWINNYPCLNENELHKEQDSIEKTLQEYFEAKKLLYEKGSFLVGSANLIFRKLGYETEMKEKLGVEDIILKRGDFRGIVEVKSFESRKAKIDKLFAGNLVAQLTAHLSDYPEKERERIKLIAVINYETGTPLSERREWKTIFTDSGLKVLKSYDICTVSSYGLFQIYNMMLKTSTEEFKAKVREKLETTEGLLESQKLI